MLKDIEKYLKDNNYTLEGCIIAIRGNGVQATGLFYNEEGVKLRLLEEAKFQIEKLDVERKAKSHEKINIPKTYYG